MQIYFRSLIMTATFCVAYAGHATKKIILNDIFMC
jgi:hypothetical protein